MIVSRRSFLFAPAAAAAGAIAIARLPEERLDSVMEPIPDDPPADPTTLGFGSGRYRCRLCGEIVPTYSAHILYVSSPTKGRYATCFVAAAEALAKQGVAVRLK